jgi:hypothetical protein
VRVLRGKVLLAAAHQITAVVVAVRRLLAARAVALTEAQVVPVHHLQSPDRPLLAVVEAADLAITILVLEVRVEAVQVAAQVAAEAVRPAPLTQVEAEAEAAVLGLAHLAAQALLLSVTLDLNA